ncbi:hypothetical protein P9112_004070 [Eukaryota sp. TZLM1-RC]
MKSSMSQIGKQGVIISGPSSAGKGTFIGKLMKDFPFFKHCVSHTTRPPRKNEVHGIDYFFVNDEEFNKLKGEGSFVETAKVHFYQYGTSFMAINALVEAGFVPLMDIDVQGVKSVRKAGLDFLFIFMYAPLDTLQERLVKRGTENEETLHRRLKTAQIELKVLEDEPHLFDHIMLNDGGIEEGYSKLKRLINL